jgi:hypothetical protein
MYSTQSIFIFLLILCTLNVANVIFRFMKALIKPEIFFLEKSGLLFFWTSVSYIITFIIQTK